jgi:hypothetical protein
VRPFGLPRGRWIIPCLLSLLWVSPAAAHDWNGIAIDKAGCLYVVDAEDGQVWKVSPAGKVEVYRKGAAGAEECDHAHHLAIDETGALYIPSG